MAIRGLLENLGGCNTPEPARFVLDDAQPALALCKLVGDDTGDNVRRCASGGVDDDAYQLGRIGLRHGGGGRGNAQRQQCECAQTKATRQLRQQFTLLGWAVQTTGALAAMIPFRSSSGDKKSSRFRLSERRIPCRGTTASGSRNGCGAN